MWHTVQMGHFAPIFVAPIYSAHFAVLFDRLIRRFSAILVKYNLYSWSLFCKLGGSIFSKLVQRVIEKKTKKREEAKAPNDTCLISLH